MQCPYTCSMSGIYTAIGPPPHQERAGKDAVTRRDLQPEQPRSQGLCTAERSEMPMNMCACGAPQEVPAAASSTKAVTLDPKVPDALCLPAVTSSDRNTTDSSDTAHSQARRWLPVIALSIVLTLSRNC